MNTSVQVKLAYGKSIDINDFEIADNQISFMFGESGIGKSIFAKSLFGLLDKDVMDIKVNGQPYAHYIRTGFYRNLIEKGFFVFQEPSTHLNPVRPIANQLTEGALGFTSESLPFLKILWRQNADLILQNIVSLYPRPHRPSGGEKQRILLAMAFKKLQYLAINNQQPSLFVFDEPTGNLDDAYRDLFLEQLFLQFKKRPFTILFITHDYSIMSRINDKHSDLLPYIRYTEAQRHDKQIKINPFNQTAYLNWLKTLTPHLNDRAQEDRELLRVDSRIQIFNRKLLIETDGPANLRVKKGEIIYLKAESGTGKTTLAKAIMGLVRADYLRMSLCGRQFTEISRTSEWKRHIWGRNASMVFQHADEALNLKSTVRGVFHGLPSEYRPSDKVILDKIREFFDSPVSTDFLEQKVGTLSGGQKQRLNLLRALFPGPEFLILDEPFNGLDLSSLKRIIPYLLDKQKSGTGILMISHNEEIIERFIPPSVRYFLSAE